MNDEFLKDLRRPPSPGFSSALYKRISERDRTGGRLSVFSESPAILKAAAGIAIVAAMVGLFSLPAVRAAANEFLELFRVQRFAAVSIDPARLERLASGDIDIGALLSDSVEVVREPGNPIPVATLAAAGELAGLPVLSGEEGRFASQTIVVRGESELRLSADVHRLQAIVDAAGIEDAEIPWQLQGQTVAVRIPAVVATTFATDNEWLGTLSQSRSPEVDLPQGVDLARLGEIGLRVAGLTKSEAETFSRSIDWTGTLVVPVPANAATFQEVGVRGTRGLLISVERQDAPAGQKAGGENPRSVLLWSEGDRIYTFTSSLRPLHALEFANSLR